MKPIYLIVKETHDTLSIEEAFEDQLLAEKYIELSKDSSLKLVTKLTADETFEHLFKERIQHFLVLKIKAIVHKDTADIVQGPAGRVTIETFENPLRPIVERCDVQFHTVQSKQNVEFSLLVRLPEDLSTHAALKESLEKNAELIFESCLKLHQVEKIEREELSTMMTGFVRNQLMSAAY